MIPKPGITQSLARFVVDTRWEDIPEQARHEAKRALLNFFAVAIAGCRTEPVELALKTLAEFSGGKQATVVGRSERIDALSAAFLNGAGANVFDYCDTHLPTVVHPTAPLAPALLAMAELRRVTGPQLLTAFVLGFEIECRVGAAVSPGHYPKGWHITSTCGVFGSAAGAAKLLGLERRPGRVGAGQRLDPVRRASANAWAGRPRASASAMPRATACSPPCWRRRASPARPSRSPAPRAGWPPWASRPTGRPSTGLGATWEVLDNSLKPYPAGFVIHPLLDCALDWRRQNPDAVVERVAVRGNPLLLQRTDRPEVATGREAQVSLQHATAAALVLGKAGLEQFTDACVNDPAVKAMRRKIEVAGDPAISTIAIEVDFFTSDGKKHSAVDQGGARRRRPIR